jgi:hypothetical protein
MSAMRIQLPSKFVPPLVAGVGLAVVATICAQLFVPYVPASIEAWPPEALSILRENGHDGVTADQWRRINLLNKDMRFLDGLGTIFLKNIRAGWLCFVFTLVPSAAYAKWRACWTAPQITAMALIACVPFLLSLFA